MRVRLIALVGVLLAAGTPTARAQDTAAGGGAAEANIVTKPPKLTKFVPAVYPQEKHDAGITASVLLSIEIGDDGKVGEVELVKGASPDFDAAAVTAAKQFVFEPAEIDGLPAPVKITYRYDFTIVEELVKAGPQINFEGVVLERFKKKPLRNVTVKLLDIGTAAEPVKGVTDDDGRFGFYDVPPGKHKVELSNPKLVTQTTEEEIVFGKKKTVKYLIEEREEDVDEDVVVRAPRIKKESVETSIRTEEARRVPGTQGDTLKVVQNLPGVGRSAFGSGALIVWGSAPNDTKINVDGVEIPSLYHVGGLRSTVNSDMVRSIDLAPGSYGADYGRGLGGLVRIELAPLAKEGVHGYVAADIMDTSAMLTAAITPRLSLGVAGRVSYLDRLATTVVSPDVGDFVPIPRYDDYQARATLRLGPDEELTTTFLASDDHLQRTIPSDDPNDKRTQDIESGYKRLILRYTNLVSDGSSVVVTGSVGFDTNDQFDRFGPKPISLTEHTWQYALRSSYRRKISPGVILSFGVDMQAHQVALGRQGSPTLPPREGDITVFGQSPPGEDNFDHWNVLIIDTAPYATAEITIGRLSLVPGLRFEPTLIEGDAALPVSGSTPPIGYARFELPQNPGFFSKAPNPRLSAAFRATRRLTLTLGGGIYGQPPDPVDMSPVFGNPLINMSRALHVSGGVSYKLRPTLTLEVVGFYKHLFDLVSRNLSPYPPVADALTQDGRGRAYGGQVLLRQELFRGFFGWVTYSLIRSERLDHPGGTWRLFDYDQTNVLAVLASYQIGRGWEVGARFRYTTGLPRTPVVGSYAVGPQEYDPIFGAQNSIRIPSFYQLDVRVERSWIFRRTKLNVFCDVQNVTDRKNPEEIIYSTNFAKKGYISGFPTLAIVGARLEF
jgi:TonB family protein